MAHSNNISVADFFNSHWVPVLHCPRTRTSIGTERFFPGSTDAIVGMSVSGDLRHHQRSLNVIFYVSQRGNITTYEYINLLVQTIIPKEVNILDFCSLMSPIDKGLNTPRWLPQSARATIPPSAEVVHPARKLPAPITMQCHESRLHWTCCTESQVVELRLCITNSFRHSRSSADLRY
jgi:hypothetical protein